MIWTNIAANIFVGTKGLQPPENSKGKRDGEATSIPKIPSVTTYTRRVKYKYAYGVPAFLALVLATAALFLTSSSCGSLAQNRQPYAPRATYFCWAFIDVACGQSPAGILHTATGYALPTQQGRHSDAPTDVGFKGARRDQFTLGAGGWTKNIEPGSEYELKGETTASYAPVPNPSGY